MKTHYPWSRLRPGEGFFVPCLDVDRVREEGLRAAIKYRIKGHATPAIRQGLLGVWFGLKPLASQRRT